jgi:hypothetical protein
MPPYSLWADWLSKFHTWPEPIQALWLVAGTVTLLGVSGLALRAVREVVGLVAGSRPAAGSLVYGVFQDRRGRWMVYLQGRGIREFSGQVSGEVSGEVKGVGAWTGPLPGPIRHDNVVRAFPQSDG